MDRFASILRGGSPLPGGLVWVWPQLVETRAAWCAVRAGAGPSRRQRL